MLFNRGYSGCYETLKAIRTKVRGGGAALLANEPLAAETDSRRIRAARLDASYNLTSRNKGALALEIVIRES